MFFSTGSALLLCLTTIQYALFFLTLALFIYALAPSAERNLLKLLPLTLKVTWTISSWVFILLLVWGLYGSCLDPELV